MENILKGILLSLVFIFTQNIKGQGNPPVLDGGIGNWYFLHPTFKLHKKITVGNELHIRRDDWSMKPLQILERPYLTYHANQNLDLTVGGSYYRIYSAEPIPTDYDFNEFHFWEQVTLKHQMGEKVKIAHRYRIEQRFIDHMSFDSTSATWVKTGTDFKNRFRYRMLVNFPIYKINDQQKIYSNLYNELWMSMTNYLFFSGFLRNRLYAGVGWQYNKQGSVELAFMNQFDAVSGGRYLSRNIIMLTLNYSFDFTAKKDINYPK
jgi:hypothetical protein